MMMHRKVAQRGASSKGEQWVRGVNDYKASPKPVPQSVSFFVQNQSKPGEVWSSQTKPKPVPIYSDRGFVPLSR